MTTHFVDTNIVLRLFNVAAPEHAVVRRCIERLETNEENLVISLQVLVEAWVVVTRPVENNGLGWTVELASAVLEATRARFGLIVDDASTAERWAETVSRHAIRGKRAHDARIVASMLSHGVSRLLTLNVEDFAALPVVAIHPGAVVS